MWKKLNEHFGQPNIVRKIFKKNNYIGKKVNKIVTQNVHRKLQNTDKIKEDLN